MPVGLSLVPFGVGILLGTSEIDEVEEGKYRGGGILGRFDIVELRGRPALCGWGDGILDLVVGTVALFLTDDVRESIGRSGPSPRRRLKALVSWVKDDKRLA